jgi:hypothetical protein
MKVVKIEEKTRDILAMIKATESPLARQLLTVGLISGLLEEKGKPAPLIIGGLALSYYSREVYFTSDIDLAYADREALDRVLRSLDFQKKGRYWVSRDLDIAVEVPASQLGGEDSPRETVELGGGLRCQILGLEDLIVDRLNACKHWKSEIDCEMVELLVRRYSDEIDWGYLEKKTSLPENDTGSELNSLKKKIEK